MYKFDAGNGVVVAKLQKAQRNENRNELAATNVCFCKRELERKREGKTVGTSETGAVEGRSSTAMAGSSSHDFWSYRLEDDWSADRYHNGKPRTAMLFATDGTITGARVRINDKGDVLISELRRLRLQECVQVHDCWGSG